MGFNREKKALIKDDFIHDTIDPDKELPAQIIKKAEGKIDEALSEILKKLLRNKIICGGEVTEEIYNCVFDKQKVRTISPPADYDMVPWS